MTEPKPLPRWWMHCRKATFAEHVAECETPADAHVEDTPDLNCPLCGKPIHDGDRRVSWFAKTGGEVDERGASHLVCPTERSNDDD